MEYYGETLFHGLQAAPWRLLPWNEPLSSRPSSSSPQLDAAHPSGPVLAKVCCHVFHGVAVLLFSAAPTMRIWLSRTSLAVLAAQVGACVSGISISEADLLRLVDVAVNGSSVAAYPCSEDSPRCIANYNPATHSATVSVHTSIVVEGLGSSTTPLVFRFDCVPLDSVVDRSRTEVVFSSIIGAQLVGSLTTSARVAQGVADAAEAEIAVLQGEVKWLRTKLQESCTARAPWSRDRTIGTVLASEASSASSEWTSVVDVTSHELSRKAFEQRVALLDIPPVGMDLEPTAASPKISSSSPKKRDMGLEHMNADEPVAKRGKVDAEGAKIRKLQKILR